MRISMKVDYGIRALVELSRRYGQGPIQTSEIAARQDIPEPFLDQVLTSLHKTGIIRSKRGPQGGHILARQPTAISLGEIIVALEGSTAPISCVQAPDDCPRSPDCAQREVWQSINEATETVLRTTSLDKLTQRQQARDTQAMYQI